MRAIIHTKFGSVDNLRLADVPIPEPKKGEVRVKTMAVSVNSWDYDWVIGRPYLYRLLFGIFKPRKKILGCDIAGVVDAVGAEVKDLKPGDRVFGDLSRRDWGGFAEYTIAQMSALSIIPDRLSFEEAAALPQAGVLALQGLRYNGEVSPGQKILFNGGAGGVGTIGLQIAKMWGAEVTCVDHGSKLDLLKSLGADHVVDYTRVDYSQTSEKYDLIIDVIANKQIKSYCRILKTNGALAVIGGSINTFLSILLLSKSLARKHGVKLGIVGHQPNIQEQDELANYVVSGHIKPVIDKQYSLEDTAEALRWVGEGKVKGKVVIVL